jgi:hypothetical protein
VEDRRRRALLGLSLVFLVLALGRFTPAFGAFRALFPPERFMRYPEKHVLGAVVLVSAFAGVGLTRLAREVPRWAIASFAAAAGLLAALVLGLAAAAPDVAAWANERAGATGLDVDADSALRISLRGGALAAAGLALAAAAVALAARPRWRRLAVAGVAFATVAVPFLEANAILSLAPREMVRDRPASLLAAEAAAPGERRVFRDRVVPPLSQDPEEYVRWVNESLAGDTATRFGFQIVPGMNPAESAEQAAFFSGRHGILSPPALTALLGIRFTVFDDRLDVPLPGPRIAGGDGFVVSVAPGVRPRAFVATGFAFAGSAEAALGALAAAEGRDPGFVVLEGEGEALPVSGGPALPCVLESSRPEQVDLVCATAVPSYAVLVDAWAPGWTATVNGAEAPILRADGLFRAVRLGEGAHRIAFRYRTPGLREGAVASVLAALGIAAALWAVRQRPTARG